LRNSSSFFFHTRLVLCCFSWSLGKGRLRLTSPFHLILRAVYRSRPVHFRRLFCGSGSSSTLHRHPYVLYHFSHWPFDCFARSKISSFSPCALPFPWFVSAFDLYCVVRTFRITYVLLIVSRPADMIIIFQSASDDNLLLLLCQLKIDGMAVELVSNGTWTADHCDARTAT
jgi:hypothetical protein